MKPPIRISGSTTGKGRYSMAMQRGHGGNRRRLAETAGLQPGELLDFSASLNPAGPPAWFRPLVNATLEDAIHYPEPDASALVEAIARRYGLPADTVMTGNGSTELLYALPRVLGKARALIPAPAYSDYAVAASLADLAVERFPLREEDGFAVDLDALAERLRGDEIVFLGQPNNPTGRSTPPDDLRRFAAAHPSTVFIVDEAYADFTDNPDRMLHSRPGNVIVLYSMTKFFAVAGLRLGFAVADPAIAGAVRRLLPPWSVNTLAEAFGQAALADTDYAEKSRRLIRTLREDLRRDLTALPGLYVYPGEANYLLVRCDRGDQDAVILAEALLRDGIAIRVCDNFEGLDRRFFRVAVRTAEENGRLCRALGRCLGAPLSPAPKRTPAVMFQGTGSNAGKSVLTAALCRILLQDGYRVAPFKAQNMSLNSFVTADGGEMGRAQVVQAQACRRAPDVRMNPVLLKPSSDVGSQVILLGKPVGNMTIAAYDDYKRIAFDAAQKAYDDLAAEADVVVLEGAGSPGEVNLKDRDIVNMAMAAYARAPVLLVGDIDRGGVFASFIGTMDVLSEEERARVAGFVVNRFRGDKGLLGPAIEYVARYTRRPTFGVVPFIPILGLPEEDSVTFKSGALDGDSCGSDVDVAVLDLPHISNFTDFDAFRIEPDVRLRIVRSLDELGAPDALILPGSKNVMEDVAYLARTGFAEAIQSLARSGKTQVVGICGGFQILGRRIADPHGIESDGRDMASGLGLLAVTTVLATEKTLTATAAVHLPSGLTVQGYEIHHGRTEGEADIQFRRADGEPLGVRSQDENGWGTYLHGVFDDDAFRRHFLDDLRRRKGLAPLGRIAATYDLEPALDRLASLVRENMDISAIYRLMGLK